MAMNSDKTTEYRHSERCVYHWEADQEHNPGYIHHCLRVTYKNFETQEPTRIATEYVVSHKETGNYPFPLGGTTCVLGNGRPVFKTERDARADTTLEIARRPLSAELQEA